MLLPLPRFTSALVPTATVLLLPTAAGNAFEPSAVFEPPVRLAPTPAPTSILLIAETPGVAGPADSPIKMLYWEGPVVILILPTNPNVLLTELKVKSDSPWIPEVNPVAVSILLLVFPAIVIVVPAPDRFNSW